MSTKKTDAEATAKEEAAEQTFLAEQVGEEPATKSAEGKNVYTYQTSSTTEATLDAEEFRKIKLTA